MIYDKEDTFASLCVFSLVQSKSVISQRNTLFFLYCTKVAIFKNVSMGYFKNIILRSVCWSSSSITYLSPLEGQFQQAVGIPMGTNCAPLLADLFLYSYESEFLQKLVKDQKIHEARTFNFTYGYIDNVLSINNSRFAEFLPLI